MHRIISRSEWGATPWRTRPYVARPEQRFWFLTHYHGGPPRSSIGMAVPSEVERIHLNNGWSGIGYNFVVDQAGTIYEARGWELVGAHCPGHNLDGIGVYVAVGGDQQPTEAALEAVAWLHAEGSRRAGRRLIKSYHGFDYPTACPGAFLTKWVKDGMHVNTTTPAPPKKETPDMSGLNDLVDLVKAVAADVKIIKTRSRKAQEHSSYSRRYAAEALRIVGATQADLEALDKRIRAELDAEKTSE